MSYSLEMCNYYTKREIKSKPIFLFDDHNMALPIWGTYAAMYGPMNLVTFDTHTDTHCAFTQLMQRYGKHSDYNYNKMLNTPEVKAYLTGMKYKREEFSFEDVYRYSFEILNTEQILTGVAFGYLKSYTVRCHNEGYEEDDRQNGYDATYLCDSDKRTPLIRIPLVLDIDLDFFRTPAELDDTFLNYIQPCFDTACAVTIAREPRFFASEREDEKFTNKEAESMLLDLFNRL